MRYTKRDLHPCTPECPDRTPECRGVCPRYAMAEQLRAGIRAEKMKDTILTGYEIESARRKVRRRHERKG